MIRRVPQPGESLFGAGVSFACGTDGNLRAEELHGLFAGDTRVLSTYRITLFGNLFSVLARLRPDASTAQWEFQNPRIRTPDGGDLEEGTIHFRLRRRVSGALHDDLTLQSFLSSRRTLQLVLLIDGDFADIFQVKARSTPPRLSVHRVPDKDGVTLRYVHGNFERGLHVRVTPSAGALYHSGSQFVFDLTIDPGQQWTCCVEARPEVDGKELPFEGDPHRVTLEEPPEPKPLVRAEALLALPFERGALDLQELILKDDKGVPFIAAGAPWFMALFGRDTLITSLMAGLLGAWPARGALAALGRLQARERDDFRDAEPGKIPHELRHGELAHFKLIPHTPYYGTHDAPELYVLALWHAFRWTGDRDMVEARLPAAQKAMAWCDEFGDLDHDGFLEYQTRSTKGYRNQAWKDAGDAITHVDGRLAETPVATVELQGYLFAARLAMAELLQNCGDGSGADLMRQKAEEIRRQVEKRFWMDDAGYYALALDRDKRLVKSISSNAGHLLWCGLPSPEHARCVAKRALESDMFSGYGIRTISAEHRRYNPLSYQLGSVWPHDTALFTAGLLRYGFYEEAAVMLRGILDAAAIFSEHRLPELFCGFSRDSGPPVPYARANSPQAWAAAVPLLIAQLLLGLQPDAPNGKCFLDPWLPEWLPRLQVSAPVAGEWLDVQLARQGLVTEIERAAHPNLEIFRGSPEAPLWGAPIGASARPARGVL